MSYFTVGNTAAAPAASPSGALIANDWVRDALEVYKTVYSVEAQRKYNQAILKQSNQFGAVEQSTQPNAQINDPSQWVNVSAGPAGAGVQLGQDGIMWLAVAAVIGLAVVMN